MLRCIIRFKAVAFMYIFTASVALSQPQQVEKDDILYQPATNITQKKSIQKLNYTIGAEGVNPLNGCLYLTSVDLLMPGRGFGLPLLRYYNSKRTWEYSPDYENDHLKAMGQLGLGWFMHFGKRKMEDSNYIYTSPNGTEISLELYNGKYISFDSEYYSLLSDTLKEKDGTKIVFADTLVTKIIDVNGNYCRMYYSLGEENIARPDSVISSNGRKAAFYFRLWTDSEADKRVLVLDSMKMKGYSDQGFLVKYHYRVDTITATPFGNNRFYDEDAGAVYNEQEIYLLTSAIYPDNDSTIYSYNSYGELECVTTPGGGETKYRYGTYGFSMPVQDFNTVPTDTSYTRSVDTIKIKNTSDDSYKTALYIRKGDIRRSNRDTCIIRDPLGNDNLIHFRSSGWIAGVSYKWFKGYGTSYKQEQYQGTYSSGTIIDSAMTTTESDDPLQPYWGPNIRITISDHWVGSKHYQVNYSSYKYGNPGKIDNQGDLGTSDDDRTTYVKYLHDDKIIDVKTSSKTSRRTNSTDTIKVIYSGKTGVDSIRLFKNGSYFAAQSFSPSVSGTRAFAWSTDSSEATYYFHANAIDRLGNEVRSDSISVFVSDDPPGNPPTDTSDNTYSIVNVYDFDHRHILDRPAKQYDSLQSTGKLSENQLQYDGYQQIDSSGYSAYPPVNWSWPYLDTRGALTTVKRWNGGTTYDSSRIYYDCCGNAVKQINQLGDSAKTIFNVSGDPDKYQYSYPWKTVAYLANDSICSFAEYDSSTGLAVRTIGPNSDTTRYTYDIMNRNLKIHRQDDSAAVIRHYFDGDAYKPVADSVKISGATYSVHKTFYDGFGRAIETQQRHTDGKAIITLVKYDELGRVKMTANPIKTSTNFGTYVDTGSYWTTSPVITRYYDAMSRQIKVVYQDSTRDSAYYYNNRVKSYDALNDSMIVINNSFGSADTVIDGLGHSSVNKYDHQGRPITSYNAKGDSTRQYYDYLSRPKGSNGPDAWSSYTYNGNAIDALLEYDAADRVTYRKNSKGEMHFTYDKLGRITRTDSSGTLKTKMFYDNYDSLSYNNSASYVKGRLTGVITCGVDTSWFVYDKLGRMKRRIYAYAGMSGGRDSVLYHYNSADACTSLVYPDGTTIKYVYNSMSQISSITNYADVHYNAAGLPTQLYYGNVVYDSTRFDNRLRTNRIVTNYDDVPAQTHLDLSYTYWQNGNVKKIQDNQNSSNTQYFDSTVSYDALGRLRVSKMGSVVVADSYDNVGNRVQEKIGATANKFFYISGTNKIDYDTISGSRYTFTHDSAGNVLTKNGAETRTFTYDCNNLLAKAVIWDARPHTRTITNTYGAGGSLRIKKVDSDVATRYYAYQGNSPLVEYDASGNVKKKYVYALGRCIAFIDSASNTYYLHHDALGSVRKITNNSGNAENTYRYYPFGSSLSTSETVTNDLKFTEKPFVSGIDAYDYSARYYDPEIARFYALDLVQSGGSPYAYCYNNPLLYIDPSGMTTFSQVEIDAEQVGGGSSGGNYDPFHGMDPGYRKFFGAQGGSAGLNWGSTDANGKTVNYAYYISSLSDASGQFFNTEALSRSMALGANRLEQAMLIAWAHAEFGRGPMPTIDQGIRINIPTLYAPLLIFDRANSTLTIQYGTDMQVFDAANNALGNGPWPEGLWEFDQWRPDNDRWFNENSDVGGSGFFQYDLSSTTDPTRTLMGIHSGRMNLGGYTYWTNGCIRTTPEGSSYLFGLYHGTGSLPPLFVR